MSENGQERPLRFLPNSRHFSDILDVCIIGLSQTLKLKRKLHGPFSEIRLGDPVDC